MKKMRLSGIDTIEAGNAFLPSFMEKYNARFAKDPFDDRDVHRALAVGHDDLDETPVGQVIRGKGKGGSRNRGASSRHIRTAGQSLAR